MQLMEISKQAAESVPARVEDPNAKAPLERLVEWESMAEGEYAQKTRRAQHADGAIFQGSASGRGLRTFRRARG